MTFRRTIPIFAAGLLVGAIAVLALPSPGTGPIDDVEPAPRPVEKVRATTLLAWTPKQLPDGFSAAAAKIPGVRAVAEVRSGIAWVGAPEGFRVPLEIAAVDPGTYRSFVPPGDATSVGQLAGGGIVLGDRAAVLRSARTGSRLLFDETELTVGGILPDSLIGAHEGVVSVETGARLGIVRPRYVLVELVDAGQQEEVERALRSVVPRGVRIRIRAPGETPEFRHGDAVPAPVRLKELFGEFAAVPEANGNLRVDPEWVRRHITSERIPVLGSVTCNRGIMPQLRAAFEEIERRGLSDAIDRSEFGGCFFPRYLSQDEEAGLSHHSWGVAIDINVATNPFGSQPRLDKRVVDVLERWGFTWGGRWLVPDGMHFEFLRFPVGPKG
jgi:hypothetical protein